MNDEMLNRVKIKFAQCDKELKNANDNLNYFYDGKIRAIARRAAGFSLEGFVIFFNREKYGNSFINHLRGLQNDIAIPLKVKQSSKELTQKMTNDNLSGKEAISFAETIINYCKEEVYKSIKNFYEN